MAEFPKHLYLILYPNEALVASQLTPEEFGKHYSVGSPRHFSGKVIFAEVDIGYRNDYFRIDDYLRITESGVRGGRNGPSSSSRTGCWSTSIFRRWASSTW